MNWLQDNIFIKCSFIWKILRWWSYGRWIYNYMCMQVPIITKVVSSNPIHGEVYSIQHYVIKFVWQWLATNWWFSQGTPVSSNNKTDRHDITEILLKVALNTINQPIILLSTACRCKSNYHTIEVPMGHLHKVEPQINVTYSFSSFLSSVSFSPS